MKSTFVLLLCLLACGTGVCLAQSKCASIVDGEVSGHSYANKTLGLSYTFPGSLTRDTSKTLSRDKNGRLLLVLWKNPPDFEKPAVTIFADDPSAYPDHTAIGYLHRIENTVKQYEPPAKILAEAREYDLSGIKFYRLDYQFPGPQAIFDTTITGQVRSCEITFQFAARTQKEIDLLVRSIDTVRFSNKKQ